MSFVYIGLPTIVFGISIWLLIRAETAQGVSRTKDWVQYMLAKLVIAWGLTFLYVTNTQDLILAYVSVRIPQVLLLRGKIIDSILDTNDDAVFMTAEHIQEMQEMQVEPSMSQNTPTYLRSVRLRIKFLNTVTKLVDSHHQRLDRYSEPHDAFCKALIGDRLEYLRISKSNPPRKLSQYRTQMEDIRRAHDLWLKQLVTLSTVHSVDDFTSLPPEAQKSIQVASPSSEEKAMMVSYGTSMLEASGRVSN